MSEKEHIVSFSGGKDSTAMLIRMLEKGMRVDDIVFADTRMEFPELYEYLDKVEDYIGRKITRLDEGDWDKWFFGIVKRGKHKGKMRGMPLRLYPCWHSREAKFKPLDKYMRGHIRYLGYAIDEKHYKRKRIIDEYRAGFGKPDYVYPLVDWGWTEQYCIEYLKSKGLHNPLYDKFNRLGCYLCPKQNKKALEILKRDYPELYAKYEYYNNYPLISYNR